MNKRPLRLSTPASLVLVSLAFTSSADAEGLEFLFHSRGTDRCLHVKGGDQPGGGEIKVFDPCQTLPEFRVERVDEILRIKLTPQDFRCLQVPQPILGLPAKVLAGNCAAPVSNWSVTASDKPGEKGLSTVILRREDSAAAACMREDPKTHEVVVDLCTEGPNWKLERIPEPPPQPTPAR